MSDPELQRTVLAVDFGTTFTVAAVHVGSRLEMVEIDGYQRMPSVVFADDDGHLLVGDTALSFLASDPARAVVSPKALIGSPRPVVLGGRPFRVGTIVAALLRHALEAGVSHLGQRPDIEVLTHPAAWTHIQREVLAAAAAEAGFVSPSFIPEPVAAAVAYRERRGAVAGHILVYDLGGGTFDAAVVASTAHGFALVGHPRGDRSLGGDLFDEVIATHVGDHHLRREVWDAVAASPDMNWLRVSTELRLKARAAKELLSRHGHADIVLPTPVGTEQTTIQRHEVEAILLPYVRETLEISRRLVEEIGLAPADLAAAYLVGGGSRLPIVQSAFRETFPDVPVELLGDPKAAVVQGAALWGAAAAHSVSTPVAEGGGDEPARPAGPAVARPVAAQQPERLTGPDVVPPAVVDLGDETSPAPEDPQAAVAEPVGPVAAPVEQPAEVSGPDVTVDRGPTAQGDPPTVPSGGGPADEQLVPSSTRQIGPQKAEDPASGRVEGPASARRREPDEAKDEVRLDAGDVAVLPGAPGPRLSSRRRRRVPPVVAVGAPLVVLALVVLIAVQLGGGGDDDPGGVTVATIDEGVKSGVEEALTASSTTVAPAPATPPASMEEWEALWATERAAAVTKINANGWGLSADGTAVTGPEGFTIDLSACPAGWSNTEGLTDTEIKIGHTTALSGTLADYGNIAKAMTSLFAYYNAEGAFTDSEGKTRTVNLVVKDDGYDPARTIPLVDELIDSEKVFAMWTLGSPNTLKTYDKLNQRCIPQPFSMSGHPAWGDPVNHPWTTGLQMAYNTEAVLWGAFIEQRLAEFGGQVKVASLIMNNDFGKAYDNGFKAFLAASPQAANIEYVTETIEPQTPTIKDPMTTLAAQDPDVFIAMLAGAPCTQAITEAAENGMKDGVTYLFMPSVCKAANFVGKDKVGGDGSASNGWWILGGGSKDFNADANSNDAFVKFGRDLLAADGLDYSTSGSFGTGFLYGWAMVQALQIAGQLEGGLTRTNLILAIRSLDMTHPLLLEGIKFNMNGNADAYLIEGSDISRYDSASQSWILEGPIIDLSGKTANCSFDQSTGTCT